MAERKSGPVKPPIIDLKARQAKPGKEAAATAAGPMAESAASGSERAGTSRPAAGRPKPKPDSAAAGEAAAAGKPSAASKAAGPGAGPAAAAPPSDGARQAPPEASPKAPQEGARPPPPPRPPARLAMPWSAISIAAIAGAVLGAGLVYLLAAWLPLPNTAAPIADPAPQLATLAEVDTALEQRLGEITERATETRLSLDATVQQLDAGLAGLRRD